MDDESVDGVERALLQGGWPAELAAVQVRPLSPSFSLSLSLCSLCALRCVVLVWEVRRQFFPQMIDSDSKMAVRASPLERFNLASISDPTHTPGPTAASAFRRPAAIPPLTPPFQTQIPPSYCVKLVEVMRELQRRRQGSAVFAGKDGFITARDLLR